MNRNMSGPASVSGCFGGQKTTLSLVGLRNPTRSLFSPKPSHYTGSLCIVVLTCHIYACVPLHNHTYLWFILWCRNHFTLYRPSFKWWVERWMMNCKGLRRKRSLRNWNSICALCTKEWENLAKP